MVRLRIDVCADSFYYADQTWQEMKNAGYRLFSVATKDDLAGAGKPAAGPSGFFAREGNIVFRGVA